MKSIEERLKKAALGAGCLFLALGAFEMPRPCSRCRIPGAVKSVAGHTR